MELISDIAIFVLKRTLNSN